MSIPCMLTVPDGPFQRERRPPRAERAPKFGYADTSWNPTTGCATPQDPECRNCWANRMSARLAGRAGYPALHPFHPTLQPSRLLQPLAWTKPRRIAVTLMGDLFTTGIPNEYLAAVFTVMALARHHLFFVLTKQPSRAVAFLRWIQDGLDLQGVGLTAAQEQLSTRLTLAGCDELTRQTGTTFIPETKRHHAPVVSQLFPASNVLLGVSAGTVAAWARLGPLVQLAPLSTRLWVSAEPLLEAPEGVADWPVGELTDRIEFVAAGCESGQGARPAPESAFQRLERRFGRRLFLKQRMVDGKLVKDHVLYGQVYDRIPPLRHLI